MSRQGFVDEVLDPQLRQLSVVYVRDALSMTDSDARAHHGGEQAVAMGNGLSQNGYGVCEDCL